MGNCVVSVLGASSEISTREDRLDLTQHDFKPKHRPAADARAPFDLTQHGVGDKETVFEADVARDSLAAVKIETQLHALPSTSTCGATSFAGCSMGGFSYMASKENQDAVLMLYDADSDTLVVACLDGHGENGGRVARFLRNKIQTTLVTHPSFGTDLRLAIADTILSAEAILVQLYYKDCAFSGSTLTLAALRAGVLLVANVGDSRVVLCSDGVASAVTADHKADLPLERARIELAGGRVITKTYDDGYVGPARVYLGTLDIPGLAMSRSLGDSLCHEVGVSSEPEFFEHRLTPADQFLVVATDGLWDFSTAQRVADQVLSLSASTPEHAVTALLANSHAKWLSKVDGTMDDTSVVVLSLGAGRLPKESALV